MQVNGKELEFDIFDAENAGKYEQAVKEVSVKMQALQKKDLTLSEGIRFQCEAVAGCFDSIFGPGTAARIFDGKVNLKLALTAFEELITGVNSQKDELVSVTDSLLRAQAGKGTDRA